MAFTTTYRGIEVRCETIEDLDALADRMATGGAGYSAKRHRTTQPTSGGIEGLLSELKKDGHKLIVELARSQTALSDAQLRSMLGLRDNKALAGVLTSVTRAAKRVELSPPIERRKERDGAGRREYFYSLPAEIAEEVRKHVKS